MARPKSPAVSYPSIPSRMAGETNDSPSQPSHNAPSADLSDVAANESAAPSIFGLGMTLRPFFSSMDSQQMQPALWTVPRIIIGGAPLAGKGTQCELLSASLNAVHVSTHAMLRERILQNGPDAASLLARMQRGELVPDEIIAPLLLDRLRQPDCEARGWVLEGFPRNAVQAEAILLQAGAQAFVFLDVPDEMVISRATQRRVDPVTGKIYSAADLPPEKAVSQRLTTRDDDFRSLVLLRLKTFYQNVNPVLRRLDDIVVRLDGRKDKHTVFADMIRALHAFFHASSRGG